jgi:hypothetical protein
MVEAEFAQIWQRVEADRKEGSLTRKTRARTKRPCGPITARSPNAR